MQKAGAGFSPGCVWSRRNQEAGGGLNSLKSQKISVLLCMAQEKDKLRLFWVFRKMGQHSKCLPRNFQSQWGWAELLVTSLGNNYHEAKIRKEILLNAFFYFLIDSHVKCVLLRVELLLVQHLGMMIGLNGIIDN